MHPFLYLAFVFICKYIINFNLNHFYKTLSVRGEKFWLWIDLAIYFIEYNQDRLQDYTRFFLYNEVAFIPLVELQPSPFLVFFIIILIYIINLIILYLFIYFYNQQNYKNKLIKL